MNKRLYNLRPCFFTIASILSIVILFSCSDNQNPSAKITIASQSAVTGETISFDGSASSDPDGSIASYSWDFGDGSAGTSVSAQHSFNSAGSYTVVLTVTDDLGLSDTAEAVMTITAASIPQPSSNKAPTASFSASSTTAETGVIVTFDGTGSNDDDGNVVNYNWDFGDGTSSGGKAIVNHSFASAGMYTVKLTVTDNNGASDSCNLVITATENILPTASFTAVPSSLSLNESVSFDAGGSRDSDGSITSYSWDFGDNSSAASGVTTSHIYSSIGNYYAILTVTDNNGAAATAMQLITVNGISNLPPTASAGNDQMIDLNTAGSVISLDGSGSSDSDGSVSSYAWSFYQLPENSILSDGNITGSTNASASFDVSTETGTCNPAGEFIYILKLVVTDNDSTEPATATDYVTITVKGSSSVSAEIY